MAGILDIIPLHELEAFDFIVRVEDASQGSIRRMRIFFTNGYHLSIVRAAQIFDPYLELLNFGSSYGYEEGLLEIAVRDSDFNFTRNFWDDEDQGDDVLGYCDYQKVLYYIKKVGMHA